MPGHPRATGGSARGRQPSARRVLDLLNASIRDGVISPDRPLAEEDLMRVFGSSRAAVRSALGQLAASGMVERRPRVGTWLNRGWTELALTDFQDDAGEIELQITEQGRVATSPLLRERLQTDDEVVRMVENTWSADGDLLGMRTAYFRTSYSIDPAVWVTEPVRMVDVLSGFFHVTVGRGIVSIGADVADDRTARLLRVQPGTALINRDITYYDAEDQPVQTVFDRFRADRVRLVHELERTCVDDDRGLEAQESLGA
ncbi:GntR family transcriptional regulator [Nocardioides bruguierae]|uniref:GntR family transcriptional regulator n=1 Tax=Nocardioides bruguierae TaxID=2945102 RepID=UPI0020220F8C|nr:GntR family transcriptional regulator [Nocardioides bruguierae]MCL8025057.1 GntR family transcriptional regulator [Nocardioides bruguierae]